MEANMNLEMLPKLLYGLVTSPKTVEVKDVKIFIL